MERSKKIFIAGQEGLIVSAFVHRLAENGFSRVVVRTPSSVDLMNQKVVLDFFAAERPSYVFLTSVKMGGIMANSSYPAEFIYANIQSQTNIIHAAWKSGVEKLLYVASSCVYPKNCPQPMQEESLMTGRLEPTSEPYAIAKIAGIIMCQSYNRQYGTRYISIIPADLYGPEDDFNPETAHVLPALIAKMHRAKVRGQSKVILWGTGIPRRECLHVYDLVDASIFLMDSYSGPEVINVGTGKDVAIKDLAQLVKEAVGFKGDVVFDVSKPDGAPRKLLDVVRISKLGWSPKIDVEGGIRQTYQWYQQHVKN